MAMIVSDPDAPSGDFIHWTIAKIAPDTDFISSKEIPSGAIEGLNDMGSIGYLPPRPPSGTHRYIFELFALNQKSGFTGNMTARDLQNIIKEKTIESAKLIGLYKRTS
jgi:Raf kinase inhibitor-like YbhB/YbcL family protein